MKKVTVLMTALMISAASFAQTWNVDKAHSKVGFSVSHMVINDVDGLFKNFDAKVTATKPDFSDAMFTFSALTNSIFTDNEKRDEHLKSADFFDAEKNPTVTYISKFIKKNGKDKYTLTGDLTMHGITKPVTLDLIYKGTITHPMSKKQVAAFNVSGKIKRTDFKISESTPSAMVGDEITIVAKGEFSQG
jgi:polyisoprenoid-binding protein YceI